MKIVKYFTATPQVVEREVVRIVQQKAPQGVHIPRGLFPNDGTVGYLGAGHYGGYKDAVKSCTFGGRRVVTYCRDEANRFCAVVQMPNGALYRYGVDLTRNCIDYRGPHFSPPVQIVRQVTVQRTRWL